jgi:hypothetical protein
MTNVLLDSLGSWRATTRHGSDVGYSRRGTLVHPKIDGILVGWLGVLIWVAQSASGENFFQVGSGFLLGVVVVTQAAHFAMSYRLAYRNPSEAIRRHPVALFALPIVLAAALGTMAVLSLRTGALQVRNLSSFLTSSVFIMSGYHFVRQSYGVSMLGSSMAGIKLSRREAKTLSLAVYPLWATSLQPIPAVQSFLGSAAHHSEFPTQLFFGVRICAMASVAAIGLTFVGIWKRTTIRPTSMMIAPLAAVAFWMLSNGSHITASLAFTATHSAQYLACTYRAERNHESSPKGWRGTRSSVYVLIVAAAVGTLLTRVLPQFIDRVLAVEGAPAMFAGMAFIFLNLTHYVADAVIWRSNGELVRSLK